MGFFNENLYVKKVFQMLIRTVAFTATLGGFLLVFFPPEDSLNKWLILAGFVVCNLILSLILAKPVKKLVVKLTDRIKVNIEFGDILNCKDNVVIPFNSDFDTKVDEIKISPESLHGAFINRVYGSNAEKLKNIIKEQLNVNSNEIQRQLLGTTLKVEEKGISYFLIALSNLDSNNKAHTDLKEYHNVINQLLKELHNNSQGRHIYIPLLGAGLSGVDLSKQELLEYLLMQIKINKDLNFNSGITIVLHKNVKKDISLERINEIYNKWKEM